MPTGQLRSLKDKSGKVINPTRNRPADAELRRAVSDAICPLLAQGLSLKAACSSLPPNLSISPSTYLYWIAEDPQGLGAQYAAARDVAYRLMADDILEISDDSSGDTFVNADGHVRPNPEFTARSRLRVDTRKWILARMLPKLYGDKVTTEVTGADGGAIQLATANFRGLSDGELELMERLVSKATKDLEVLPDVSGEA